MERGKALAAVTAGLAAAAVSVSAGSFFVADQRVEQFRLRVRPLRGERRAARPRGGESNDVLDTVGRVIEVGVQILVGLLVLVLLTLAGYYLVLGLRRLARLHLDRSLGSLVPAGYADSERSDDDAGEKLRRRVRGELDLLASELDAQPDPREAVIACYVRMEAAAAAAGTPRQPYETPAELVARLLAEQQVPEPDVRRLVALFEEARFSRHPVDDEMRAAARRSLAAIRDALGVPV